MRNRDSWRPTKVRALPDGRLRIPAAPEDLSPGSTLVASLAIRWYAEALPRYAHGVLLEIGAGRMPLYELYRDRVDDVVSTDWPASLHGLSFIDFASDLNDGVPLGDGLVSTVIGSDVLEHIYQPQALLADIRRVLKPGGVFLFNTPFLYWIHEAPHDYYRYTPYAITRMAADAGLAVAELRTIGSGGVVLADVAGKLVQRLPVLGKPLARAAQRAMNGRHRTLPESATFPLLLCGALRRV